jgi:hypothetical protein
MNTVCDAVKSFRLICVFVLVCALRVTRINWRLSRGSHCLQFVPQSARADVKSAPVPKKQVFETHIRGSRLNRPDSRADRSAQSASRHFFQIGRLKRPPFIFSDDSQSRPISEPDAAVIYLVFNGQAFPATRANLKLFSANPSLRAAKRYDVKSSVPREVFRRF